MTPLKQFTCDTCGQLIEKPEDGYVEWLSLKDENKGTYINSEINIVHQFMASPYKDSSAAGCYQHHQKRGRHDLPLTKFLGENNMAYILKFLDMGPYHDPESKGPYVNDIREYVEFVRRITIPYFEEARQYWGAAESDGFFGSPNEVWIYSPNILHELVEKYGDR